MLVKGATAVYDLALLRSYEQSHLFGIFWGSQIHPNVALVCLRSYSLWLIDLGKQIRLKLNRLKQPPAIPTVYSDRECGAESKVSFTANLDAVEEELYLTESTFIHCGQSVIHCWQATLSRRICSPHLISTNSRLLSTLLSLSIYPFVVH